MASPAVSVVLPVRDGGDKLLFAVRSVLLQSIPDWELLVLDDGSTDSSLLEIEAIRDTRIQVIRDPVRRGLAHRLNQGIGLARGDYIARMDADDIAFPRRLELQAQWLDRNRAVDLLGTRALAFELDGHPIGLLPFRQSHAAICRRPWLGFHVPHPTWMGRIAWFRQYRYRIPEVHRAEDQELLLRSYPKSRFECLTEVLLGYRLTSSPLHRTLGARYRMAGAQAKAHFSGGRPVFAVLGVGASLAKGAADIALVLAGKKLRTARGLESASPTLLEEWKRVWRSVQELGNQRAEFG